MADWQYAQCDRSEQLAQISYYSAKKHENGREIEFRITVKEFVSPPPGQHTRFFAEADKKVNQKSVALLQEHFTDDRVARWNASVEIVPLWASASCQSQTRNSLPTNSFGSGPFATHGYSGCCDSPSGP